MKRLLRFLATLGVTLVFLGGFMAAQVTVTGTRVLNGNGGLLSSGQWCAGSTCFSVTNGVIAQGSSVAAGTYKVTVTNGLGSTYLTVPGVALSGTSFVWDGFVLSTGMSAYGIGLPPFACQAAATYTQTDNNNLLWTGTSPSGACIWNAAIGSTSPNGMYAGTGAPAFNCTSPCLYIQTDAPSGQAFYALQATAGTVSNNWIQQAVGATGATGATGPAGATGATGTVAGSAITFATSGGAAPNTTYNGSAAVTVSPSTIGAVSSSASSNVATPNWNAALLNVKNGTGFARLLANGDSTTFGYCSTGICSPAGGQSYNLYSYPHQLCTFITTNYSIKCEDDAFFGAGVLPPYFGISDSRITQGSSWSQDLTVNSLGYGTYKATTSTNAFVFTPISTVDTFEVYFIQDTTEGACAVSINGGTASTVTTNGVAAFLKQTYTTTATPGNSISISESSGTCHLVGIVSYLSTNDSVIVMNDGAPAANIAQLTMTGKPYNNGVSTPYSTIGANLVIDDAGINDWLAGTNLTTFSSTYQTLISAEQAAGADVILKSPAPSGTTPSNATQSTYVEAMRALARTNTNISGSGLALPFIDGWNRWGSYTNANALGWYPIGNQTHPNQYGYADIADSVGDVIIPPSSRSHVEQRLNSLVSGGNTASNLKTLTQTTTDGVFGSSQTASVAACEAGFGTTATNNGTVTISTTNTCLPLNAIIDAIVYRITTTISGNSVASFTVGTSGVPAKYCTAQSTLTAGTTGICLNQWNAAGSMLSLISASKVFLAFNQIPTAGAIRVIVYYHTWTPPTN